MMSPPEAESASFAATKVMLDSLGLGRYARFHRTLRRERLLAGAVTPAELRGLGLTIHEINALLGWAKAAAGEKESPLMRLRTSNIKSTPSPPTDRAVAQGCCASKDELHRQARAVRPYLRSRIRARTGKTKLSSPGPGPPMPPSPAASTPSTQLPALAASPPERPATVESNETEGGCARLGRGAAALEPAAAVEKSDAPTRSERGGENAAENVRPPVRTEVVKKSRSSPASLHSMLYSKPVPSPGRSPTHCGVRSAQKATAPCDAQLSSRPAPPPPAAAAAAPSPKPSPSADATDVPRACPSKPSPAPPPAPPAAAPSPPAVATRPPPAGVAAPPAAEDASSHEQLVYKIAYQKLVSKERRARETAEAELAQREGYIEEQTRAHLQEVGALTSQVEALQGCLAELQGDQQLNQVAQLYVAQTLLRDRVASLEETLGELPVAEPKEARRSRGGKANERGGRPQHRRAADLDGSGSDFSENDGDSDAGSDAGSQTGCSYAEFSARGGGEEEAEGEEEGEGGEPSRAEVEAELSHTMLQLHIAEDELQQRVQHLQQQRQHQLPAADFGLSGAATFGRSPRGSLGGSPPRSPPKSPPKSPSARMMKSLRS